MNLLYRRRSTDDLGAAPASAPWGWALAGAAIGLLAVLAYTAPARWLAHALASLSGNAVVLAEPQGSVWNGSARLVLTGGSGAQDSMALPGRVRWTLSPAWLGLSASVNADCCTNTAPLVVQVHPGWASTRVAIADGSSVWPASLLTGLGTPWNTIQPQGDLALATRGLSIQWAAGRVSVSGAADITARSLSSRLSTLRPMGSYRLVIQGGDAIALDLSTLEGSLQMSGSGQWIGSRLRFSGEAHAAPGLESQLANLLNIIGRRQGDRAIISLG